MSQKPIIITKSTGDTAVFSIQKVAKSLRRAGASAGLANEIAAQVGKQIKPHMRTSDVHRIAFSLLKKNNERPLAARYSLKQAILALGPTGYPFERFVAELLKHHGYQTKVGVIMKGSCVNHEVDVVATKGSEQNIIECKFHNQIGYQTNVKVPLYVRSRFLDIERELKRTGHPGMQYVPWIVTNTQFSKDAQRYGECMKMKLIGWRYPKAGGLEKLIEDTGLHPLTCLTTLTRAEKEGLLKKQIVLCNDAIASADTMKQLGMSNAKIDRVVEEARGVCQISD